MMKPTVLIYSSHARCEYLHSEFLISRALEPGRHQYGAAPSHVGTKPEGAAFRLLGFQVVLPEIQEKWSSGIILFTGMPR